MGDKVFIINILLLILATFGTSMMIMQLTKMSETDYKLKKIRHRDLWLFVMSSYITFVSFVLLFDVAWHWLALYIIFSIFVFDEDATIRLNNCPLSRKSVRYVDAVIFFSYIVLSSILIYTFDKTENVFIQALPCLLYISLVLRVCIDILLSKQSNTAKIPFAYYITPHYFSLLLFMLLTALLKIFNVVGVLI